MYWFLVFGFNVNAPGSFQFSIFNYSQFSILGNLPGKTCTSQPVLRKRHSELSITRNFQFLIGHDEFQGVLRQARQFRFNVDEFYPLLEGISGRRMAQILETIVFTNAPGEAMPLPWPLFLRAPPILPRRCGSPSAERPDRSTPS